MATVSGALAHAPALNAEPASNAACRGRADRPGAIASARQAPQQHQQQQQQQRQLGALASGALSARVEDLTRAKMQLEIKVQQCTQEAEKVQAEKMAAVNELKAVVEATKHLRREKCALAVQLRQLMRRTGKTARGATA